MVRKTPADRYQTSKEVLDDIRACRKSLPVPVTDWRKRQRGQASLHERYDVTPSPPSSLGQVFRGRDRRSDAKVDVTVLRKELAASQQQQILQIAKRLVETRHPGLVQYFEVEQYEEGWTVVREHPAGDSLLDMLRRHGPAGMERALPCCRSWRRPLTPWSGCGCPPWRPTPARSSSRRGRAPGTPGKRTVGLTGRGGGRGCCPS